MAWWEVSVTVESDLAQKTSAILEKVGALSVSLLEADTKPLLEPLPGTTPLWEGKVKVVGLFPEDFDLSTVEKVLIKICPKEEIVITSLADQDWTRTWLEHFHPISFGKRLIVAPLHAEVKAPNDAVVLRLDPGLAFGTGTHPTTALCLRWLDANPPIGKTVIDYGCGSGILGIAALLLGAKKVFAVDYDPQALLSARENAIRNGLDETQILTLLPEELPPIKADVVLANILAEPLIALSSTLENHLSQQGRLILSGLLTSQVDTVKAAYKLDFDTQLEDEWALLQNL